VKGQEAQLLISCNFNFGHGVKWPLDLFTSGAYSSSLTYTFGGIFAMPFDNYCTIITILLLLLLLVVVVFFAIECEVGPFASALAHAKELALQVPLTISSPLKVPFSKS